MDALLQQECELEDQIKTYQLQLNQVKEKGPEMSQLLSDLSQLIALTEESLMELKKQKLLMMLHDAEGEGLERATSEGEGLEQATPTIPELSSSSDEGEEEDDIVGMKCSVPLNESWGGGSHHNAVILLREPSDLVDDGDYSVRVLFSQPLYTAMKPCPFLLEGSCKYSEEDCKYSHGHVTQFSKLRPFREPDYSLSHTGGRCLAKHEDGLWYPGIISSMGEHYVVYYPSLSRTAQVNMEDVLPLESSDDDDDVSGDGGGEEEEEVVEWRASDNNPGALGGWERHTNGIGSKLLFKMGYVTGQGLGKVNQGRVNPVEIVVLPAGKSLDVCVALREANKVRKVDGEGGVAKERRRKGLAPVEERQGDMFDFLNNKVFSHAGASRLAPAAPPHSEEKSSHVGTNLNVKLFKVQEMIKSVRRRKLNLMESLKRHQKRKDKQLIMQTSEKLAQIEEELERLHKQEKSVEKNISTKSQRKKLSLF